MQRQIQVKNHAQSNQLARPVYFLEVQSEKEDEDEVEVEVWSDQQELPGPDVKGEKEVEDHNTMGMLQLLHFKRGRGI